MNTLRLSRAITLVGLAAVAVIATADDVVVKKGTDIELKLAQNIDSRLLKEGDTVMFKIAQDFYVKGKMIFKTGMPVAAVVEDIQKKGRYGKNGQVRFGFEPVKTISGDFLSLQERHGGNSWKGSKTDKAAIATGAGALILGPIGLLGGMFVEGKPLVLKAGTQFGTTVARTETIDA